MPLMQPVIVRVVAAVNPVGRQRSVGRSSQTPPADKSQKILAPHSDSDFTEFYLPSIAAISL